MGAHIHKIIYICIYVHTVVYSIYIQMCRLLEVALQAPCNRCKHICIESTHLPVASRCVANKKMVVCVEFVARLGSILLDRAWLHTCHPSARRGARVGSGPCDWTMHSVLTLSFKSRCVGCAVAIGHRQSARPQGLQCGYYELDSNTKNHNTLDDSWLNMFFIDTGWSRRFYIIWLWSHHWAFLSIASSYKKMFAKNSQINKGSNIYLFNAKYEIPC